MGEHEHGEDVDFPMMCQSKLHMHSSLICKGMMKEGILPTKCRDLTYHRVNQGYAALREMNVHFHPTLMKDPQAYTLSPKQHLNQDFNSFLIDYKFHLCMLAFCSNQVTNMGDRLEQDRFIQCLKYAKKMTKLVRNDRHTDPWRNSHS